MRNPADPLNTLNTTTRIANLQPPASPTRKGIFYASLRGHGAAGIAFWARLIETVPLGIKASADFREDNLDNFKIDTLETKFFMPSIQYLEASIAASSEVQSALKGTRFRSSLYIVTGIKIAKGARFSQSTSRGAGGQFEAVADSGQGASAGGTASAKKGTSGLKSFENSSPFVFAFQLRKIVYKKKKVVGTEPRNEGAMLGADVDEEEKARRFMTEIEVEGLEEVNANSKTSGLENAMIFEEGPDGDIFV
jgi:hypothetical protein